MPDHNATFEEVERMRQVAAEAQAHFARPPIADEDDPPANDSAARPEAAHSDAG